MVTFNDKSYASSAELFFAIFDDKMKLHIVWLLQNGPLRFKTVAEALQPITNKTLTKKLKELETLHLITRHSYPEVPPRVEYALSEHGEALKPVINEVLAWSQNYARAYAELIEE